MVTCFQEPLYQCVISCVNHHSGVFISTLCLSCHALFYSTFHMLILTDRIWEQWDNDSLIHFYCGIISADSVCVPSHCSIPLCSSLCPCRRFFQTAHFYVEESSSPRVVANENIPVIPIPGEPCFIHDIRIFLHEEFILLQFYVQVVKFSQWFTTRGVCFTWWSTCVPQGLALQLHKDMCISIYIYVFTKGVE